MSRILNKQSDHRLVIGRSIKELGALEATPDNHAEILQRLEWLAANLDDKFHFPGTKIRFGWDSVIGLIPVLGDTTTTLLSAYFMWEANRLGISKWTLWRMLGNVGIDFVVGAVPIVGDLCDVTWRANRKNLRLLKKELDRISANS